MASKITTKKVVSMDKFKDMIAIEKEFGALELGHPVVKPFVQKYVTDEPEYDSKWGVLKDEIF